MDLSVRSEVGSMFGQIEPTGRSGVKKCPISKNLGLNIYGDYPSPGSFLVKWLVHIPLLTHNYPIRIPSYTLRVLFVFFLSNLHLNWAITSSNQLEIAGAIHREVRVKNSSTVLIIYQRCRLYAGSSVCGRMKIPGLSIHIALGFIYKKAGLHHRLRYATNL